MFRWKKTIDGRLMRDVNVNNEVKFCERLEYWSKMHKTNNEKCNEKTFVKGVLTKYLKKGKVKHICELERNEKEIREVNKGKRCPEELTE